MKLNKVAFFCLSALYGTTFTAGAEYLYDGLTVSTEDVSLNDNGKIINTSVSKSKTLTLNGDIQAESTLLNVGNLTAGDRVSFEDTSLKGRSTLTLNDNTHANNTVLEGTSSTATLNNNATATNTTLNNISYLNVNDDASISNTTVNDNSTLTLSGNASADVTTTHRNMTLHDNAVATNTHVKKAGRLNLNDHASASHIIVDDGGYIYTYDDSRISDTVLNGTSLLTMYGNSYGVDTVVNKDSKIFIRDNSLLEHTTVTNGGYLGFHDNASTSNTLVQSGGNMNISASGSADITYVEKGGRLNMNSTASASQTVIDGGTMLMSMNATATDTQIAGSGTLDIKGYAAIADTQLFDAAALTMTENTAANGTTLNGMSVMTLSGSASAQDTTINDAGVVTLTSGTSARDTLVNSGLFQLHTSALATGSTVVNRLGEMIMEAGAYASDLTLKGGMLSITDLNDETISLEPARVDTLASDQGIVSFLRDSDGDFAALSIGTLSGTGAFLFNTSMAERNGNFVTIDSGTGQFNIIVHDSGREIADPDNLTVNLVNDKEGNIDFTLVSAAQRRVAMLDAGVYMYSLYNQQDKDQLEGNVWYLGLANGNTEQPGTEEPGPEEPGTEGPGTEGPGTEGPGTQEPGTEEPGTGGTENPDTGGNGGSDNKLTTPSTDAVLNMASAVTRVVNAELDGFRAWRSTLAPDNLPESSVWGHYTGSNSRVHSSNGAAYRLEQHGIEIGADKTTRFERGSLVTGVWMSSSANDVRHARGGKSTLDSYGLGAYATWFDRSGFYADGVIKGNRLNSDLRAKMTNGGYTKGDWHQYALSGALEGGYRHHLTTHTYVEPYVRTSAVQANRANVTLSNGMKADTGKPRSLIAEAGTRVGSQFTLGSAIVQPYVHAAVVQETAKSNEVTINGIRFDNNVNGASGRYGAGTSLKLAENTTLYGEVNYRQGRYIEEPVQGVLGLKMHF